MAGPLTGCRIIEMAGLGPGPFAAMLLADLGADVVRVERAGTQAAGSEQYVMHRGRRSIAIDLKHPHGRDIVLRLAERSDALIEGFRPGVMERLGLGPDDCRSRNARLVYGRMTGWGQDGPLAPTAGHDIDYIAISGALGCIARAGERPVVPVNFLGDFGGGGLFLAFGIVAAMWEATRSGTGQVVDAAMVDGSAVITTMLHGLMAQGRWRDEAGVNFADGGSNYYDTYECADGRHVAVGAIEGPFYAALLDGLGLRRDELPDRARATNWPALKERFAAVFRTRTRDEWAATFAGTDACVAPVLGLSEAPLHPHNVEREVFVERGGIVQPAPAPRFDRTPNTLDRLPPRPGEHTDEVLREIGYDATAIAELLEAGTVTGG
ncbi:MAG: CaiB/BaiF CoA transferase family protein [Acidimicrobiia bacterium]